MAKKTTTPYPVVRAAKLTIDVAALAPRIIDEHEALIAEGNKLRSPVIVNMRRDGSMTVPFVYRSSSTVTTCRIEVYAGWMFGGGPDLQKKEG